MIVIRFDWHHPPPFGKRNAPSLGAHIHALSLASPIITDIFLSLSSFLQQLHSYDNDDERKSRKRRKFETTVIFALRLFTVRVKPGAKFYTTKTSSSSLSF